MAAAPPLLLETSPFLISVTLHLPSSLPPPLKCLCWPPTSSSALSLPRNVTAPRFCPQTLSPPTLCIFISSINFNVTCNLSGNERPIEISNPKLYLPKDRLGFPPACFNGMPDSPCAKTNAFISLANISQALTTCRHCQTLRTPSEGHGFCLPRARSVMGLCPPLLIASLFTYKASESSGRSLLPTSHPSPS